MFEKRADLLIISKQYQNKYKTETLVFGHLQYHGTKPGEIHIEGLGSGTVLSVKKVTFVSCCFIQNESIGYIKKKLELDVIMTWKTDL